MRRLQFSRALGFKPALLLRQQSGGGALTVAPVAEADEFLLKFGVEPPHARAGRFGLLGMAERAEAIGGRLAVHAARGEGTTLRVVVPVHHADPPAPPAAAAPTPAETAA